MLGELVYLISSLMSFKSSVEATSQGIQINFVGRSQPRSACRATNLSDLPEPIVVHRGSNKSRSYLTSDPFIQSFWTYRKIEFADDRESGPLDFINGQEGRS